MDKNPEIKKFNQLLKDFKQLLSKKEEAHDMEFD